MSLIKLFFLFLIELRKTPRKIPVEPPKGPVKENKTSAELRKTPRKLSAEPQKLQTELRKTPRKLVNESQKPQNKLPEQIKKPSVETKPDPRTAAIARGQKTQAKTQGPQMDTRKTPRKLSVDSNKPIVEAQKPSMNTLKTPHKISAENIKNQKGLINKSRNENATPKAPIKQVAKFQNPKSAEMERIQDISAIAASAKRKREINR